MKRILTAMTLAASLKGVSPVQKYVPTVEDVIEREAKVNGVRVDRIRAIIEVESAWDPSAVSNRGAIGLMQVMPDNAKHCGYKPEDLYKPEPNIVCGTRLYKEELTRFKNHFDAHRAYNCGAPKAAKNKKCGAAYARKVVNLVG